MKTRVMTQEGGNAKTMMKKEEFDLLFTLRGVD